MYNYFISFQLHNMSTRNRLHSCMCKNLFFPCLTSKKFLMLYLLKWPVQFCFLNRWLNGIKDEKNCIRMMWTVRRRQELNIFFLFLFFFYISLYFLLSTSIRVLNLTRNSFLFCVCIYTILPCLCASMNKNSVILTFFFILLFFV